MLIDRLYRYRYIFHTIVHFKGDHLISVILASFGPVQEGVSIDREEGGGHNVTERFIPRIIHLC